jgi:hypothetical protein
MIEAAIAPGYVQKMKRLFFVFALLALTGSSGCLKATEDTSAFEPTTVFEDSSEIYAGSLSPQGTQFKVFSLTFGADTKLSLVSIMSGSSPLFVPLSMGLGTPNTDGTTCTPTITQTVIPALTTQITQALVTGNYCVQITDPGNLPGEVKFAVRIRKTLTLPSFGTPGTDAFSTNLYPGGAINRTFGSTAGGEVKVALTSVSPQASVGLGLGVTDDGLSDCFLNQATVVAPGATAQLTANAEPGFYCVKVFDAGGLPDRVLFNVQITHP